MSFARNGFLQYCAFSNLQYYGFLLCNFLHFYFTINSVNLILDKLEVNEQIDFLVEFGSGYGTFTIPSIERIRGNVLAFDIDGQMIEFAATRAVAHKAKVNFVKRDFIAEGTGLSDNSVDYVMLFNILHHINPLEILNEAYRILKTGGKAGLIHWNYDPTTPRGPSLDIRPKPEEMRKWAKNAGFRLAADNPIDLPPYHYGFLLYKE